MAASSTPIRVLITGAYGLIGNLVYARLASQPDAYQAYGMVRRTQHSRRIDDREFCEISPDHLRLADLTDFSAVQQAVQGVDVVVHMAADPDGRSGWESVLNNNINGAYHIFEACRMAGVKRVIYGSTNQVSFGYRKDEAYRAYSRESLAGSPAEVPPPIRHDQPTRPPNLYACSKVFGESLARMYADAYGLSGICLRIGWVLSGDEMRDRTVWCSQRDIVQLVELSINAPASLLFDIFFGQSDNQYNLFDIQHAKDVLGYAPQDRAEEHLK